jgi:hypothetical protein
MRAAMRKVFGQQFVKVCQVGPRVASGGLLGDQEFAHDDNSAPLWTPDMECAFACEWYAVAHQLTPSLAQLLSFCRSASAWLDADARNVVIVCSARGASLSGVFVAALTLYRLVEVGVGVGGGRV